MRRCAGCPLPLHTTVEVAPNVLLLRTTVEVAPHALLLHTTVEVAPNVLLPLAYMYNQPHKTQQGKT